MPLRGTLFLWCVMMVCIKRDSTRVNEKPALKGN